MVTVAIRALDLEYLVKILDSDSDFNSVSA
jgi:hypothetical protein